MIRGLSSRSNLAPTTGGTLEKPSPVGSSHGYRRFMRCGYSSASGGFGFLAPQWPGGGISAKPLKSYLLANFMKQYIKKLIYYNLFINNAESSKFNAASLTYRQFLRAISLWTNFFSSKYSRPCPSCDTKFINSASENFYNQQKLGNSMITETLPRRGLILAN